MKGKGIDMQGKYKLTAYIGRNMITSRFIENPEFIQHNALRFTELGLFYDDEPEVYPEPKEGIIISGCAMELEPYKE